jgi:hypothetical protein
LSADHFGTRVSAIGRQVDITRTSLKDRV